MIDTHYSDALKIQNLAQYAKDNAEGLVKFATEHGKHPLLVYRGMSGVAHATAVAMCLHLNHSGFVFGQYYLRKEEEETHSNNSYELFLPNRSSVSYDLNLELRRVLEGYFPVFVDDFVDSGETMAKCVRRFPFWTLKDWMILLATQHSLPGAECVEYTPRGLVAEYLDNEDGVTKAVKETV